MRDNLTHFTLYLFDPSRVGSPITLVMQENAFMLYFHWYKCHEVGMLIIAQDLQLCGLDGGEAFRCRTPGGQRFVRGALEGLISMYWAGGEETQVL